MFVKPLMSSPYPGRTIALSGAFDVLHPGHTRMIQGALNFGSVIIILNSDDWVRRNKGALIMPWHDRRQLLLSVAGVLSVVPVEDSDDTVCEALTRMHPDIHVFGNGGVRTQENTPERELCRRLGIKCVWGIGGAVRDSYDEKVLRSMRRARAMISTPEEGPD